MYEMVTGKVPFDHENGVTIALMHLQNDIVPPSEIKEGIPDSLEKIILKCVMKKPEERYQTAEELIEDLKLVFQDTSGDYVGFAPVVDDSPTIMVDQEELHQQLEEETKPEAEDEEEAENGYLAEDDEEEEGMNSKIEKLIIVLAAVVGAIILIAIISFVVRSSGLFRSGDEASTEQITTTESSDEETKTDKYQVPNVVGMSLSQAKEAIGDNLKIKTKEQSSSNYKSGLVISQSLESDSEVNKGDTITLTVSSGEKKITVPNVKGKSQASATSTLKNAGFKVRVKTSYSSSVDEGDVISQSPSSGSALAQGSTVTITVSSGSERVTVPSLSHYTESEARQQLKNMGLTLGSVSRKYDDSVQKNYVISQSISSGTKVAKGTAVGITVSLGSRPTTTTDNEEEPDEEEPDENE